MENAMTNKSLDLKAFMALIMFAVILAGGIFYAKPLWEEVDSLAKGRDDMVTQKNSLEKKLYDLRTLQQSLNLQTEVSRETNLNAIPVSFEEDVLIRDLNGIADQSRVTVNGISFGIPDGVQKGEIGKVTVSANLSAQQSDLLTFLRGVEADSRKIVIKSIAVQLGQTDIGGRVNFNVSMETYFQGTNQ